MNAARGQHRAIPDYQEITVPIIVAGGRLRKRRMSTVAGAA